jgi:hypothetical protein
VVRLRLLGKGLGGDGGWYHLLDGRHLRRLKDEQRFSFTNRDYLAEFDLQKTQASQVLIREPPSIGRAAEFQ